MRRVADTTGRFTWRPWYKPCEIDAICEERVRRFLQACYGTVAYPLTTNDLVRLIEQDVDDLDLYADLSCFVGGNGTVEGVTTFVPGRRPRIRIARALSEDLRREARLRTTLAHELGHVLLHRFICQAGDTRPPSGSTDGGNAVDRSCTPWSLTATSRVDWMEWQAGYASGALLMPRGAVQAALAPLTQAAVGPAPRGRMGRLLDRLQGQFLVSAAAAYVRLHQLGYLSYDPAPALG